MTILASGQHFSKNANLVTYLKVRLVGVKHDDFLSCILDICQVFFFKRLRFMIHISIVKFLE